MTKCYSIDEILLMSEMDDHVRSCPKCLARFKRKEEYDGLIPQEQNKLHTILSTLKRERNLPTLQQELVALPEAQRFTFLQEKDAIVPGAVLIICKEAQRHHFISPKTSETWLLLARRILDELQKSPVQFRPSDLQWMEAKYLLNQGNLHMVRGNIQEAHKHLISAYQLLDSIGDEFQQTFVIRSLLFTLTKTGRVLEAESLGLKALATLRAYDSKMERYWLLNNLALVQLAMGKTDRAEKIILLVMKYVNQDDEYYNLVIHNHVLIQMEKNNYGQALQALFELRNISNKKNHVIEEVRTLIIQGEIHLLQGHNEEALEILSQAELIVKPLNILYDVALIQAYTAKALTALYKNQESIVLLQRAIAFFAREAYSLDLVQALELWEQAQQRSMKDLPTTARTAFDTLRNLHRLTTPARFVAV
jgi:tetratricopeptide (TPR) repeat protein